MPYWVLGKRLSVMEYNHIVITLLDCSSLLNKKCNFSSLQKRVLLGFKCISIGTQCIYGQVYGAIFDLK